MEEEDRRLRTNEVLAGQRMSEFLNDALMQEHLNGLLHGWQNMWLAEEDASRREQLWMRSRALQDFIQSLQSVVDTGHMAAMQLEQDKSAER